MIRLNPTTDSLELLTSVAGSIDYDISFTDITATADSPDDNSGNIATATTTTVLSAPAASTVRQIHWANFFNAGTANNTVTVKKDISGTELALVKAILRPGERLQYTSNRGFVCYDANGSEKVVTAEDDSAIGRTVDFFKVGTALEAAGVWYSFGKDTGAPGAWAPGTPGVNGRNTDGLLAADNGCIPLWNATNSLYIDEFDLWSSVVTTTALWDIVWVNSGLVVTTTTAQAIAMAGALPARDLNDSSDGTGYLVGVLVTTATTNAAAITNMTLSYTNELGVSGRTGTMAAFPATAVQGAVAWFQLAGGDKGVRSIQSVTFGTSLVAGAVSLIVARRVVQTTTTVASLGNAAQGNLKKRRKISKNACLIPMSIASATTAQTISGTLGIVER
jgi:hypothetical protein